MGYIGVTFCVAFCVTQSVTWVTFYNTTNLRPQILGYICVTRRVTWVIFVTRRVT